MATLRERLSQQNIARPTGPTEEDPRVQQQRNREAAREAETNLESMRAQFRSVLIPIFQDVAQINGLSISGKYKPFVEDIVHRDLHKGIFGRGQHDGPLQIIETCNTHYEESLIREITGRMEWGQGSQGNGRGPHNYEGDSWGNRFEITLVNLGRARFDRTLYDIGSSEGYSALQDSIVNYFANNRQWYSVHSQSEQA